MNQYELDKLKDDVSKSIIRERVSSINAKVESSYRLSLRRWGLKSEVRLEKGERMAQKLACCFAGVKAKLNQEVPGIQFNPPEVFPVNKNECVVLITGWKPEIIILRS